MTMYMLMLTILSIVIIAASLWYTFSVAKTQRRLNGELDTPIPDKVQEGIYTKNPVFLAYAGFVVGVLIIIFVVAKTM